MVPLHSLEVEDVSVKEEFSKRPSLIVITEIVGKPVKMEVDTGGTKSLMSLKEFKGISRKICPTDLTFKTYYGEILKPLGYSAVKVKYKNQVEYLNLYIVEDDLMDMILGREWLYKINLDSARIKVLTFIEQRSLTKLLDGYAELFNEKLGEIKKIMNVVLS